MKENIDKSMRKTREMKKMSYVLFWDGRKYDENWKYSKSWNKQEIIKGL